MPIKSEKPYADGTKKGKGPSEDLKRVEFEETPIMSTYVLCSVNLTDVIAFGVRDWGFRVY